MRTGISTDNKGGGAGTSDMVHTREYLPENTLSHFGFRSTDYLLDTYPTLNVTENQGGTALSKINLNAVDFVVKGRQTSKLCFELEEYANYVEFRGTDITNSVSVYLSKIEVSKVVYYG